MNLKTYLDTLDALTDAEADNLNAQIRAEDVDPDTALTWAVVKDSVNQMPDDVLAHYGSPAALKDALDRVLAVVGPEADVRATYALPDYAALGQDDEETILLARHDLGESLHAYESCSGTQPGGAECDCHFAHDADNGPCTVCSDTAEGLMHNNTWRSVEPLMDAEDDDLSPSVADADYVPTAFWVPNAPEGEVQYEVSIANTFSASSPSEAITMMVAYLADYASTAGYRVTWQDPASREEQTAFIDAEVLNIS